jgi:predicted NAD/FAD-dependent oxidoreductase
MTLCVGADQASIQPPSQQADGAVKQWKGPVGNLEKGKFDQNPESASGKLWVGAKGMGAFTQYLAKGLRTKTDTWVARVDRREDGKWRLFKDSGGRNVLR